MPSGRMLTRGQRDKLFNTWCECRSVRETARKCRVSPTTAFRYMDEDHWIDRHEAILRKAQQVSDDKAVYNLKNELNAVNVFINAHIKRLAKMLKDNKLKATPKEFRELVRLKADLLKDVEPELPTDPERDKTAELLEKFSEQALVAVGEAAAAELKRNDDKKR